MVVSILAEFTVAEENIDSAKVLFNELGKESLKEEGCLAYVVLQVFGQEEVFVLLETFANKEAQDFHKTTEHYKNILKGQLEPLIIHKKVRFLVK